MKNTILIPFICLIVFIGNFNAQSTNLKSPTVAKQETIVIKTWGHKKFEDLMDTVKTSCKKEAQKAMGFKFETVAGCMVEKRQTRAWNKHNRKQEKRLIEKFGKNWTHKHESVVKQCVQNNEKKQKNKELMETFPH